MTDGAIPVEVCVTSVEAAVAAELGGAARVELCDNPVEGGTTPSAGMIAVVRARIRIGLFVLIRPRGGDFCYSIEEREVMRRDIAEARNLGADGIVLGLLQEDGQVDVRGTAELVQAARSLGVTFHRAFDLTRGVTEALDRLIGLGIERVLTSGQAPTALEGALALRTLVQRADDRIVIMAGGGINHANVSRLVTESGVREVHLSGSTSGPSPMVYRNERIKIGKPHVPNEYLRIAPDVERIRGVVEAVARLR